MTWEPVHFDSFDDVPMHHRPLKYADREIVMVRNDREGTMYFHKPSTNQYWIQIGFVDGKCPTDRCGAQCCKEGSPWPKKFGMIVLPNGRSPKKHEGCPFLTDDLECGIQQGKFLCCASAPAPWNGMENLNLCEIRCVEVRPT